jgi:hypothetical protein
LGDYRREPFDKYGCGDESSFHLRGMITDLNRFVKNCLEQSEAFGKASLSDFLASLKILHCVQDQFFSKNYRKKFDKRILWSRMRTLKRTATVNY